MCQSLCRLPEGVVPLVTGLAPEGTDLGHDEKGSRKHATVVTAKSVTLVIPHMVKDCNRCSVRHNEFYKKVITTCGGSAVWAHAKEAL